LRKANTVYPLNERQDFSIIYDELWDCYLPYIGTTAALLYCYLQRMARHEVTSPSGATWQAEVCAPLGLSLAASNEAWARLQEFRLVVPNSDESYSLAAPKSAEEFKQMVRDYHPVQQTMRPLDDSLTSAGAALQALQQERRQWTLIEVFEQELRRPLSPTELAKVLELEQQFSRELVEYALELAVYNEKVNLAYVSRILENWRAAGVSNRFQAERYTEQGGQQSARSRRSSKKAQPKTANPWDDLELYRLPPTQKGNDPK
jgi:DnaD/phage-associated family protein